MSLPWYMIFIQPFKLVLLAVHERQREKKQTEEHYRAKDRKRKRDKYAELVG